MKSVHGAAVLALLLPAAGALAQPRVMPPGDVTVTYRLDGPAALQIPGGAPDGVKLEWDAAGQRLRAEPIGGRAYAVTDLRRHVAEIVFPQQASVLELPLRIGTPEALLAGSDARFTPIGNSRVLGMDCTEWTVQAKHMDARGCITPDGVVLRAEGLFNGQQGSLIATAVHRGPIPEAAFTTPPGFGKVSLAGKG
jgi:hypothetical protein